MARNSPSTGMLLLALAAASTGALADRGGNGNAFGNAFLQVPSQTLSTVQSQVLQTGVRSASMSTASTLPGTTAVVVVPSNGAGRNVELFDPTNPNLRVQVK